MPRCLQQPWSVQATMHGDNDPRRKGCELVKIKIVAAEPRPTREAQGTVLRPNVARYVVIVPEALAEGTPEAGRLAEWPVAKSAGVRVAHSVGATA